MFADKTNRKPLLIGESAYVITPDNNNIYEQSYTGYGSFNGYDIYELVVDWNREFIGQIFKDRCISFLHFSTDKYADSILLGDEYAHSFLKEYLNSENLYLNNWKRELGLQIANFDSDNAALPFPIKIASSNKYTYDELPPSNYDPYDGFDFKY